MKAALKNGSGEIIFRDIEPRPLGPGEIRIKVDACGICGTDLQLNGNSGHAPFGHEIAGKVLESGPGVTKVSAGDAVVLDSATPCGFCANCKNGEQELCLDIQSFFILKSFGFAEEMIAPAVSAVPNPGLDPAVATLSEPLGVALDMSRLADIRPGSHVVVSGLGPIGLMALRIAKLSGASKIYACDVSKARTRLDLALEFGADEIIEADKTPVSSYKFSQEPDRFMVSSPPVTLPGMFQVAAKGAVISFIGIKFGDGAKITFDANDFHFKKLQLRASFASPAMFGPRALSLLKRGDIPGERLVTHRFPLTQTREALDCARNNPKAVKVVVLP
jgi:threonine dehydrogenase-like Zn-dependent dehydrogenase